MITKVQQLRWNKMKKSKDKKRSPLPKKSKTEHAKAKARVIRYFNKYIRLRDTDKYGIGYCCTSGVKLLLNDRNAQAGHFIPATREATRFDERNVHLQSLRENYFLSGNPKKYRQFIIDKYGGVMVDILESISQRPKHWKVWELKEIGDIYKEKCKALLKTKLTTSK